MINLYALLSKCDSILIVHNVSSDNKVNTYGCVSDCTLEEKTRLLRILVDHTYYVSSYLRGINNGVTSRNMDLFVKSSADEISYIIDRFSLVSDVMYLLAYNEFMPVDEKLLCDESITSYLSSSACYDDEYLIGIILEFTRRASIMVNELNEFRANLEEQLDDVSLSLFNYENKQRVSGLSFRVGELADYTLGNLG